MRLPVVEDGRYNPLDVQDAAGGVAGILAHCRATNTINALLECRTTNRSTEV